MPFGALPFIGTYDVDAVYAAEPNPLTETLYAEPLDGVTLI